MKDVSSWISARNIEDKHDNLGNPRIERVGRPKFKRGNLVHIKEGSCQSHFEQGCDAIIHEVSKTSSDYIIDGEYVKRYRWDYEVMFPDDGNTSAWYEESTMTLIDEGGEHLIEQAGENGVKLRERNTDINYIVSQFRKGQLNLEGCEVLLKLIGFTSSFDRNGEFGSLYLDWRRLQPAFIHIINAPTLEEANEFFTEEGKRRFNIEAVWNAFHTIEAEQDAKI
jgi:hypothetical protein